MSRYEVPNGSDEWQPGSGKRVLRNLRGIKSVAQMDRVEYTALVAVKLSYFERIETETSITAELILAIHKDWLGDIYAFAGKVRSIDLIAPPQGEVPEFRFCHAAYIPDQLNQFEKNLLAKHTPCRAESIRELAEKLAEVHAEFIAIHPFREGNGRVGRMVTELMALQAGFPSPDHGFASKNGKALRDEYYRAMSIALHKADYGPLADHFEAAILRAERSFLSSKKT